MQDDLVFLPGKVAKGFGEISPLLLCTRVSSALVLTDPATLRSIQIEVRTLKLVCASRQPLLRCLPGIVSTWNRVNTDVLTMSRLSLAAVPVLRLQYRVRCHSRC